MKKFLIVLSVVIIGSLFHVIDVSAANYTFVTSTEFKQIERDQVNNKNWYDAFDVLLEKRDLNYKNYLIVPGGFRGFTNPNNVLLLEWNDDDIEALANIYKTNTDSKNILYFRLRNSNLKNIKLTNYSTVQKKVLSTEIINDEQIRFDVMITQAENLNSAIINFEKNITRKIRFKTNQIFKLFDPLNGTDAQYYNRVEYELNDLCIEYRVGDPIFTENGWYIPNAEVDSGYDTSNKQLNSIDIYLDKVDSLKEFDITIEYHDLSKTNARRSFESLYGLVNEGGIYHWEEILNHPDDNTRNPYDILENTRADDGFKLKERVYVDFTKYEKIRFSVSLENAYQYSVNVTSTNSYVVDHAEVYFNKYLLSYFKLDIYTRNHRNVFFTTKEKDMSGQIYVEKPNGNSVFAEYFNTESFTFTEYSHFLDNYNDGQMQFIFKEIGLDHKKGFVVYTNKIYSIDTTVNVDEDRIEIFRYSLFFKKELYFSFGNDPNNIPIIGPSGDIVIGDYEGSGAQIELDSFTNIFDMIRKKIKSISSVKDMFNAAFAFFYENLIVDGQVYLLLAFILGLILAVLKFGGWRF